jgi:hypothetical protein
MRAISMRSLHPRRRTAGGCYPQTSTRTRAAKITMPPVLPTPTAIRSNSSPTTLERPQIPKLTAPVLLPPAGPQAQGWTGTCKSCHCQFWLRVGIHPRAIGQDRPSRLGPAGEGRSDGGVQLAELSEVPVPLRHLRHLDPQTRIVLGFRLDYTDTERDLA